MTAAKTSPSKPAKPRRALLSDTSILILSAFLVGHGSGRLTYPGLQSYMVLAGVVGVVAYLGLKLVARFKEERTASRAYRRATQKLSKRINRHIPRQSLARREPEVPGPHNHQYLTVVSSRYMT